MTEPKPETVIVLDKVRWARGKVPDCRKANYLLSRQDGALCCLGYCMAQLGFPADGLVQFGEPADAMGSYGGEVDVGSVLDFIVRSNDDPEWTRFSDCAVVTEAISINDDTLTSDEQKIAELNEQFSKENVKFVLVDTPEECEALGGLSADFAKHLVQKVRLPAMIKKVLEIRDSMTFIPVLAINTEAQG